MKVSSITKSIQEAAAWAEEVAANLSLLIAEWGAHMPPVPDRLANETAVLRRCPSIKEVIGELTFLTDKLLRDMGWDYGECMGKFPDLKELTNDQETTANASRSLDDPDFKLLWEFRKWLENSPYDRNDEHDANWGPGQEVGYLTGDGRLHDLIQKERAFA